MSSNPEKGSAGKLVLIASVALETAPLRRRLHDMGACTVGRKPALCGTLAGMPVLLLEGGMGKTNAAQALTAALETQPVRGVIAFGVGGAYPRSGLDVGGVAVATSEIYGDEGVEGPTGWLSTAEIGIPLLGDGATACFNEIPLNAERAATAATALTEAAVAHVSGRFVTVSSCSGTAARGLELSARFGAVAESMEGAAYAHVAALYGVPCVEVRGISNRVEDRDLSRWRLEEAAEAAARAAAQIVACW